MGEGEEEGVGEEEEEGVGEGEEERIWMVIEKHQTSAPLNVYLCLEGLSKVLRVCLCLYPQLLPELTLVLLVHLIHLCVSAIPTVHKD